PAQLADAVLAAAHAALTDNNLDTGALPATTSVERPRNPEHGDYAYTLALQLARTVGWPSRELANSIADKLRKTDGIASVEIAGPGFLNIRLDKAATGELARVVVQQGRRYGHSDALA